MVPSKIAYSLAGAYTGSFVPFINVFLTSIGLTVSEAGFIGGMRLGSASIAGPLWGLFADYTGYRRLIFLILCLGAAFTIFSLPWSARAINMSTHNKSLHDHVWKEDNETYLRTPQSVHMSTKQVLQINQTHSDIQKPNRFGFTGPLFYIILLIIFVSNIFDVPVQGFVDSFVMNVAKSSGKNVCFGMQRVFGSVSFGVANFVAGLAADHYHQPKYMSRYTAVFYVFMPCILLLIPAGLLLLKQTKWQSDSVYKDERIGVSKTKIFLQTFRQFDNVFFIMCVFLVGVASAVLLGYLFLLMDHEMKASKSIMGSAVLISCLVQVLLFPYSDKIIKKFGALPCIEIALFSYCIRFMFVSYIINPWLILPTQLLHCFGFALFWASAIEHIQCISRKEIYVTMYSLLNSVYYGLGGLVGNIIGGIIFTHYGGQMLFRGTAILCGIWGVIMIFYYHVTSVLKNKWLVRKVTVVPTTYKGNKHLKNLTVMGVQRPTLWM